MTDLKPATAPEQPTAAAELSKRQGWWSSDASESVRRNLGLVGVLVAIWIVGAITVPRIFLHAEQLWNNELIIFQQSAAIGVIAIGMTFVIIGGGIDLSVGALVALTSVWCTTQATQEFGPTGMVFTALLVGTIAGLVNGFLIAYGRVVAFIATLAMLVSARGLAQLISGKRTQRVNIENVAITNIAENDFLGIPYLVWMLLVVGAIGWVVLNRTTFGRRTFAVGGNPEAARLAGINLRLHTMLLYGLSGLCCGIAAIMVVAQATAGAPDHGDLYELDAIAAAIIGGTALAGGRGSIVGAILGVLVFKGITNLFIVNNLEQEYQLIVKGAIIIGAVLLQQVNFSSLPQLRKSPT